MREAEIIVQFDDVHVVYGKKPALAGINLKIRHGEAVALTGSNGAGKSTTLRVLIGQVRPMRGRVMINGLETTRDWDRIKPLIGYVPDRDNHFDELSGRDNLAFFAGLYDVPNERVDLCLDMVGLSDVSNSKVGTYTTGMKRKLLVARAI